MNESSISMNRLAIAALWGAAAAIKVTAWIVGLTTGNWNVAMLIAMAVVPASAGAGVAHVRGYACRVSRQIRMDPGRGSVLDAVDLHPIR